MSQLKRLAEQQNNIIGSSNISGQRLEPMPALHLDVYSSDRCATDRQNSSWILCISSVIL